MQTVRNFYDNYKNIIQDPVTIMNGTVEEYSGYMSNVKVYEYLLDYTISSIYIDSNDTIVIEIKENNASSKP